MQQADQTHPSIVLVDPYSNMYAFKIHVFQRPPSSDVCDRADIDCLFEEQNDDDHDLELWSFSTIDALCGGLKKQKNCFLRSWNSFSEIYTEH